MTKKHSTILLGEVLFDQFPDGSSILGGAPFNVAWHLQGFGEAPLFISRRGQDELGRQIETTCEQWQLTTRGLQVDPQYPTGRVEISLTEGQPSFSILPDQAYDFIDTQRALATAGAQPCTILYHGSLLARTPHSLELLHKMRHDNDCSVFVDINLRAPWWHRESAILLCRGANWLKINDDEVYALLDTTPDALPIEQAAQQLRKQCVVDKLLVTEGAKGAFVLHSGGIERVAPAPLRELVDTVGAGDAFSAVTLLGIIHSWPLPVLLERAAAFASRICEQRGATAPDPALYAEFLCQWDLDNG